MEGRSTEGASRRLTMMEGAEGEEAKGRQREEMALEKEQQEEDEGDGKMKEGTA